jgi:Leucine-rich repeat (LRR) protein
MTNPFKVLDMTFRHSSTFSFDLLLKASHMNITSRPFLNRSYCRIFLSKFFKILPKDSETILKICIGFYKFITRTAFAPHDFEREFWDFLIETEQIHESRPIWDRKDEIMMRTLQMLQQPASTGVVCSDEMLQQTARPGVVFSDVDNSLNCHGLFCFTEQFALNPDISAIRLYDCKDIRLHPLLTIHPSLEYIGICRSQIILEDWFHRLSFLKSLKFFQTLLPCGLPESFGNLKALRLLSLIQVPLTQIPSSMGNLINLMFLELKDNQICDLPDSIGSLTNLCKLSIRNNKVSSLPESFQNLINLESLSMDGNEFKEIPDSVCGLENLASLDLSSCKLMEINPKIANLTHLRTLVLKNNLITTIPPEIVQLSSLHELNLRRNTLLELPPFIFEIAQLDLLDIGYTCIDRITLPENVSPNISYLFLDHNNISCLPDEISKLPRLVQLHVQFNKISKIPASFGELTSLEECSLAGNQIDVLCDCFGEIQLLESLDLSKNNLNELPPSIARIHIGILNISKNQFTEFPAVLRHMGAFESLVLCGNPISKIPNEEFFQKLNVAELKICGTNIKSIPEFMWQKMITIHTDEPLILESESRDKELAEILSECSSSYETESDYESDYFTQDSDSLEDYGEEEFSGSESWESVEESFAGSYDEEH